MPVMPETAEHVGLLVKVAEPVGSVGQALGMLMTILPPAGISF